MFGLGSAVASEVASAATEVASLPVKAGKAVFSEVEAFKHINALTELSSKPVDDSQLVDHHHLPPTLQYVYKESQIIKETAEKELVDVEIDLFPVKSGDSDQKTVVLRILPKDASEAKEQAVLLFAHDTSSVAVMLELSRVASQSTAGFKHDGVIFFFNAGDEDPGHMFTQHKWNDTVRVAIDLDSVFSEGKKPSVFQWGGPHSSAIGNSASEAKYPSGQILAQDIFSTGVIQSTTTTDFQVYKEDAGLSGLDFAFGDNNAVYHTKNEKPGPLKPGTVQHLGENLLAFLLQVAGSNDKLPSQY
ncbi:hypothetical protein RIF29_23407 [Crotalaria pallida]|uniref:Vacuolar membrane protease n=1 Tax=Crotalaria pallida TaxID=3830 RepID=A0AAN9I8K6_CROPI